MGELDAENHLWLAHLHLRSGSSMLARPVMMEALKMEKKAPLSAALNVLEYTAQLQDWKLGREFADAVNKAWPDTKDAKLSSKQKRLGALIDIDSGENPKRGAQVLEELIKLDPLDAPALILLAQYRTKEKRFQEAEMLLQQAARVEGSEYDSHLCLAKLYVSQTRYKDALEELDLVIDIRASDSIQTYRTAIANLVSASE